MTNAERHQIVAAFRHHVYDTLGITLFPHQAAWQLATEGWLLLTEPAPRGSRYVTVAIPEDHLLPDEQPLTRYVIRDQQVCNVRRTVLPRLDGIARVASDLCAFKAGKSFSAALWATGFACVPDAKVEFIGLEYATSEPEYNYLLDFLLSEPPQGMGMGYEVKQNDTRGGRMRLVLSTGAEYKVASWTRRESLKGKKRDAYIYTEAYQLPGLEVFTSVSQNLREREGFAVFTTTPDRPWISELHDRGHGADPHWHCTCGVDARSNPFTYDQRDRDRDDPDKGGLMTRERYAIAWQGMLGSYVGQVYNFQRGQMQFTPGTHPQLFWPSLHRQPQEMSYDADSDRFRRSRPPALPPALPPATAAAAPTAAAADSRRAPWQRGLHTGHPDR